MKYPDANENSKLAHLFMKRIYPHYIQDNQQLSVLLTKYLAALQASPLEVQLRELSANTLIPEGIFNRLCATNNVPPDDEIQPSDYHILFANLLFRYPTVKIWEQDDHEIVFEM
jgi:hypothetical protein